MNKNLFTALETLKTMPIGKLLKVYPIEEAFDKIS